MEITADWARFMRFPLIDEYSTKYVRVTITFDATKHHVHVTKRGTHKTQPNRISNKRFK